MQSWEQSKGILVVYEKDELYRTEARIIGLPDIKLVGLDRDTIERSINLFLKKLVQQDSTDCSLLGRLVISGECMAYWEELPGFCLIFPEKQHLGKWVQRITYEARRLAEGEKSKHAH